MHEWLKVEITERLLSAFTQLTSIHLVLDYLRIHQRLMQLIFLQHISQGYCSADSETTCLLGG